MRHREYEIKKRIIVIILYAFYKFVLSSIPSSIVDQLVVQSHGHGFEPCLITSRVSVWTCKLTLMVFRQENRFHSSAVKIRDFYTFSMSKREHATCFAIIRCSK